MHRHGMAGFLMLGSMLLPTPPLGAVPLPSGPCPPAATATVDGFYRWYLASGDRYREDFASQRQRFTAGLYRDLRQGFAMEPSDGGFVDFDPFSNTQVSSYGHRIEGCRPGAGEQLILRVDVLAGLRRQGASPQPLDYVLTPSGLGWRIEDIRYPSSDDFSLRQFLSDLIHRPASRRTDGDS